MGRHPTTVTMEDERNSDKGTHDTPVPQDWPHHPVPLRDSVLSPWQRLLIASWVLLIPAAFITLAVLLALLHEQSQSDYGSRVIEAANISATIWPIAFAAVVGTALKSIALFSSERGTTIGTLEVLLTSLTMANTLKSLVWTRLVCLWTPILLFAWALSPLGGQSVLRAVRLSQDVISTDFRFVSYPTSNFTKEMQPIGLPTFFAIPVGLHAISAAAFSSSATRLLLANGSAANFDETVEQLGGPEAAIAVTQQDIWGNVRIPFLHMLDGYDEDDPFTWRDIPDDAVVPYESLIGLPIRGVPGLRTGNATMMVQSSYITVSCEPWINGTAWLQENIDQLYLAAALVESEAEPSVQETITTEWPSTSFFTASRRNRDTSMANQNSPPPMQLDMLKDEYLNEPPTQVIDETYLKGGVERPLKQKVVFVADETVGRLDEDFLWNMTMCSPTTSYIDAQVTCSRISRYSSLVCTAERARHTPGQPVHGNTTVLSFRGNLPLLSIIPRLLSNPEGLKSSLLSDFLRNPTLARPSSDLSTFLGFNDTQYGTRTPLDKVPMPLFEARLAAILNTAIRASYEQSIIVGSDGLTPSAETFSYEASVNHTVTVTPLANWDNGTGTWEEFTEAAYEVDAPWLAVFALSTLVMTIFALGHVALQYRVNSPDFLTSVSALTRDSPFVAVPAGGSGLSGAERARLLRKKRVKIQDVQPDSDVGRIAFGDSLGGKLHPDRLYL